MLERAEVDSHIDIIHKEGQDLASLAYSPFTKVEEQDNFNKLSDNKNHKVAVDFA